MGSNHPVKAAVVDCGYSVADGVCLLLARRALAALRRLAMRLTHAPACMDAALLGALAAFARARADQLPLKLGRPTHEIGRAHV